jgi:biopolymer transport protein ExbD
MTKRLFKKREKSGYLQAAALTPMVDMLTLLLLFLLQSYSTDPPTNVRSESFNLPSTSANAPLSQGATMVITESGIFINDLRITGTDQWIDGDDTLIRPIYDTLHTLERGHLQIRADADIPYSVIRKVLFTSESAGWLELAIVAEQRSSL